MTTLDTVAHTSLSPEALAFIDEVTLDAAHGLRALRESGTLPFGASITITERITAIAAAVTFTSADVWTADDVPLGDVRIVDLSSADAPLDRRAFEPASADHPSHLAGVLAARPDLTTIAHVRSPYLAAWAQTGRPLPIRYVPVQRWTLASELPIRTPQTNASLVDFIVQQLQANPHTPAVIDANGGAAVWGSKGLLGTLEYLQVIEEGAQFQILAAALGGSQPLGPGVLVQQWRMSGLEAQARAAGLLAD